MFTRFQAPHSFTISKTVVVGMSGGVDSAVASLLLKQQGYNVIGLFIKSWNEKDPDGSCTSARDFSDLERICAKLQIPYTSVDLVKDYWDRVFSNFLAEIKAGFTPNPDILCNREIKFDVFLEKARELGADFFATGHYCRLEHDTHGSPTLLKGLDTNKDQSYFLHAVKGEALRNVLFPLGAMTKPEIRKIAEAAGISVFAKKGSTGICFIGERRFRPFLKQYLSANEGEIRTLDEKRVGTHMGSAYFTLGQRKGLGLGGEGEPWFIVKKDTVRNILYVARGDDHPALYAKTLFAENPTWISGVAPGENPKAPYRCWAKIRYRQADQACTITAHGSEGGLRVDFDEPQRAIAPGQFAVFYQGDVCLGGAVIRGVGDPEPLPEPLPELLP
ncbi:tRNA 2-thiouridine(34) synthase MnmA [Bdellovibrionota bacterium FG-2]